MQRAFVNAPALRLLGGALVMLAAIGVQFAMVIGLLDTSIVLSLGGYIALFIGMAIAVTGFFQRRA
jgi:hypothetical protein